MPPIDEGRRQQRPGLLEPRLTGEGGTETRRVEGHEGEGKPALGRRHPAPPGPSWPHPPPPGPHWRHVVDIDVGRGARGGGGRDLRLG